MLRILVRNIASNWIGFLIHATIVFFLTPFVVEKLGDARYGVWALVTSFTGYYGLLDLGFRSGITQYLARHLATRNFDELNRAASTAWVALSCCGTLVAVASVAFLWIAPIAFTIPIEMIDEARWCIAIIGLATSLQFPFFLYSSVFASTQRYDLANVVSVGLRLMAAAVTVVALSRGYGLVGLCVINAVAELLGSLSRWRIARRLLPELRLSLTLANWASLRSIANFGLWSFIIQNANSLKASVGALLIGIFLPVAALTPYSLAIGLITYYNSFFQSMAGVFFPAATQLDAQGDMDRLRTMYLLGSKVIILLAMSAALIGVVWATDFYRLWVGERFVDGGAYPSVALLFSVLMVAAFLSIVQSIGSQVLLGSRKLRQLALLAAAEAGCSLLLGIWFIQYYGLTGIAGAVLISSFVFRGIMHPATVCRVLNISLACYLRLVWFRPLLFGSLLLACLLSSRQFTPSEHTWLTLLATGFGAGLLSLPLLYCVGLNAPERKQYLSEPAKQILTRVIGRRDSARDKEERVFREDM